MRQGGRSRKTSPIQSPIPAFPKGKEHHTSPILTFPKGKEKSQNKGPIPAFFKKKSATTTS